MDIFGFSQQAMEPADQVIFTGAKLPYDIDEFELIESTKVDALGNTVDFTNFSYFQPWSNGADGFSAFLTIYHDPVERTIQFMKTTDGENWSQAQKISIAGRGAYQISGQCGSKLATAFNYHPVGEEGRTGLDWRTNLYYVETLDNGVTWQTVDGKLRVVAIGNRRCVQLPHACKEFYDSNMA